MEINKMLSLSTAHVTERTAHIMENFNIDNVVIYDKPNYGWFVYVPDRLEIEECQDICPDDLYECLLFARDNGCDWIMFDCDVEPITELKEYPR